MAPVRSSSASSVDDPSRRRLVTSRKEWWERSMEKTTKGENRLKTMEDAAAPISVP